MTLRRFYIPPECIQNEEASLPDAQAHHLKNVLRLSPGTAVEVFDGEGNGYSGEVELRETNVFISRLRRLPPLLSSARLTLASALIKPARWEWALEKATELGIDEFQPLNTNRSDIRIPANKIPDRVDRWKRIAMETCRQCQRLTVPSIHSPMNFPDFIASNEYSTCARILFYENSRELWRPDRETFSIDTVLCVGPEGGWTEDEVKLAERSGWKIFGLGSLIFRAETAAIAATAILRHQRQLFYQSRALNH